VFVMWYTFLYLEISRGGFGGCTKQGIFGTLKGAICMPLATYSDIYLVIRWHALSVSI
jgi:hypothetical protein